VGSRSTPISQASQATHLSLVVKSKRLPMLSERSGSSNNSRLNREWYDHRTTFLSDSILRLPLRLYRGACATSLPNITSDCSISIVTLSAFPLYHHQIASAELGRGCSPISVPPNAAGKRFLYSSFQACCLCAPHACRDGIALAS
jgi:hypothetical protein